MRNKFFPLRKALLLPAAVFVLLVGCRPQENISQLKDINDALEKANLIIEDNNMMVYEDANSKLIDPRTHTQALIWQPRMQIIWRRSREAKVLIDNLKAVLINLSDSLNKADAEIVDKALAASEMGSKLFNKLGLFEDSMSCVFNTSEFADNSGLVKDLRNDSVFVYKNEKRVNVRSVSPKDWLNKNFAGNSPYMALLALNKIAANVISTEGYLINYCNYKIVDNYCGYDPVGIASINSSVVKPGDTIVVTAGVGIFSDMNYPRIFINGIPVKLNNRKVAVHSVIASGKPGEHTIPVKMEYVEPDGRKMTRAIALSYSVTDNK
jgi:hypothetical protein